MSLKTIEVERQEDDVLNSHFTPIYVLKYTIFYMKIENTMRKGFILVMLYLKYKGLLFRDRQH